MEERLAHRCPMTEITDADTLPYAAISQERARLRARRVFVCVVGMLLAPPGLLCVLIAVYPVRVFVPSPFWISRLVLAMAAGLLFIRALPFSKWIRIVCICIYAPLMVQALALLDYLLFGGLHDGWI